MLDYLEQFVKKYSGTRSWGFFWHNALSHDLLNKIGVADEDFESFFIRSEPYLKDSIVVVVSDHGHRYHSIRESVIGRLEARMPFLAVILPAWFKKRFPQDTKSVAHNMKLNSQRMTTQFDIYETFQDIVKGVYGSATEEEPLDKDKQRAYSLFKRVPIDRQCHTAGIPDEYCPCYQEIPLDPESNLEARMAAQSLLNHINSVLLKEGPKCSQYSLSYIKDVSRYLPHMQTLKGNSSNNL